MSDQRLKIAVFIDFDNVEIGVKTTLGMSFDVGAVLEAIKERGEIITKVAYGDWKRSGEYGRQMANHAIRMVQRVMTPGGDKNGADINLALDALEMAFTHDHINAFVVVGGDSDFITLVEKLKQYDKKVFVVGGRAFTSQVMQKNCTEFIAYENVARGARPDKSRPGVAYGSASLDQAVSLVKRALKVLSDREVTPQLGLLKSTLLQLDSSFSERDYGASTFRDFAEKLAQRGIVMLSQSGRNTLVQMAEGHSEVSAPIENVPPPAELEAPAAPDVEAAPAAATTPVPVPGNGDRSASLEDGIALVRRALAEAPTSPRWPMYLRQMKQFLRSVQADYDERKYGSIVELMRACQKEGLVRMERDRQGGLRVFQGSGAPQQARASQPQGGWAPQVGATEAGPAQGSDTPTQRTTPIDPAYPEPGDDIGNRARPGRTHGDDLIAVKGRRPRAAGRLARRPLLVPDLKDEDGNDTDTQATFDETGADGQYVSDEDTHVNDADGASMPVDSGDPESDGADAAPAPKAKAKRARKAAAPKAKAAKKRGSRT